MRQSPNRGLNRKDKSPSYAPRRRASEDSFAPGGCYVLLRPCPKGLLCLPPSPYPRIRQHDERRQRCRLAGIRRCLDLSDVALMDQSWGCP
jgi:hypothetical protein